MFDLIEDPEVIAGYLTDASNVPGHASGLVRPTTSQEVAAILKHCTTHRIPVTMTAGRTSTTAGAVPAGGWLISTERMTTIHAIDHDHAHVDAGVMLGELQETIEGAGRFYPPDPTSRYDCTVGASIATNASGARSFRYGSTRSWVQALEIALADGSLHTFTADDPVPAHWPAPHWTEPPVKTAAGYAPPKSALDLFIGSEGTLGVITAATLQLTDLPPEVFGVLAWFPDRESAVVFTERARSAARADPTGLLSPRCLEYLDHHCLSFARTNVGDVPPNAQAALFCEQEVWEDDPDDHLAAWFEALESAGAIVDDTLIALDAASQAKLHKLRHAVPAGINEIVVRNGMRKVGTDLAVPDSALRTMMDAYEQAPLEHALFGHIGDNHLHLNLMPKTQADLTRAKNFYDELAKLAISLGGTISAEHGIGKLKRKQLAWMVGDEILDQFRALKSVLDPAWILGRGNVVEHSS